MHWTASRDFWGCEIRPPSLLSEATDARIRPVPKVGPLRSGGNRHANPIKEANEAPPRRCARACGLVSDDSAGAGDIPEAGRVRHELGVQKQKACEKAAARHNKKIVEKDLRATCIKDKSN